MPLPLLALPIAAAAGGAAIEAIPSFLPNAATRENKRRLEELQKMQELGTLGLTEEEKQSIFGSQQAQIQGALQSSQAQARAAGAAGMQGAGAAQLQAAKAAETQANLVAQAQRGLEAANIQRKRELEQEIQARIAAKAEKSQERAAAIAKIGSAGFEAGMEELGLSSITGGSKIGGSEISNAARELGMSEEAVTDMLRKILESGDLQSYTNLVGE
jgi:hypothetical protein